MEGFAKALLAMGFSATFNCFLKTQVYDIRAITCKQNRLSD